MKVTDQKFITKNKISTMESKLSAIIIANIPKTTDKGFTLSMANMVL
jgi:hypothetical protein